MKKISLFMLASLATWQASALTLEEFMQQVQNKHRGLKSLSLSQEASEDRRVSGNLGLVPVLQLKGQYTKDEKQPNMFGARQAESTIYSLGLNQKFSTGTAVAVTASAGKYENPGIANPATSSTYSDYISGGLGFSLSQSLWKDAFGRGTRLRQTREQLVSQAEKTAADIQLRALLVEAEKSYWDYIYLQEELKLRNASLERARRIESWVLRRVNDGIGDRADLLNAKALVATRQLQLQSSEDDFKGALAKMKDWIEIPQDQNLPEVSGSIYQARTPQLYLNGRSRVISFESLAKALEAKAKKTIADETQESVKSDLVLSGSYSSNPYRTNDSISYGVNNLAVYDKPTSSVSLAWTYLFDTEVKKAQISQAQKEALSSQLKSERSILEGETQWKEYLRRYQELTKKINIAADINKLQSDRAKSEQDKLSKGRSITQNVIFAEQDAAEAELNLTKLKAEQRKLETQSRLFISIEENI